MIGTETSKTLNILNLFGFDLWMQGNLYQFNIHWTRCSPPATLKSKLKLWHSQKNIWNISSFNLSARPDQTKAVHPPESFTFISLFLWEQLSTHTEKKRIYFRLHSTSLYWTISVKQEKKRKWSSFARPFPILSATISKHPFFPHILIIIICLTNCTSVCRARLTNN